LIEENNKLLK